MNLINDNMNEYLENKIIHEFQVRQGNTFKNKWRTYFEMGYSFYLACTGIEVRQPQVRVEEDRWIVSIDMNKKNPLNIDLFCNDPWMSMQQIHPDLIQNNTAFMKRVHKGLRRFRNDNETRYNYL